VLKIFQEFSRRYLKLRRRKKEKSLAEDIKANVKIAKQSNQGSTQHKTANEDLKEDFTNFETCFNYIHQF